MKLQTAVANEEAKRPGGFFPVISSRAAVRVFQSNSGLLSRAWKWVKERQAARGAARRLHVAATVPLGEKRFAAVLEVDGLQFLVGGGAGSVALLAQLTPPQSFEGMLQKAESKPAKALKKRAKSTARPAAPKNRTAKPAGTDAVAKSAPVLSKAPAPGTPRPEALEPKPWARASAKTAVNQPAPIRSEAFIAAAIKPSARKHGGLLARKQA